MVPALRHNPQQHRKGNCREPSHEVGHLEEELEGREVIGEGFALEGCGNFEAGGNR
jgi:hypothetical protein